MNIQIHPKNKLPIITLDYKALNSDELYSLLTIYGAVILRDSIKNPYEFGDFVRNHSSKLSLDPARQILGGTAQLVDSGLDAIGLHCENGNSPFWSDLTWFYCEEAPEVGSQTTICDGVAVVKELSVECLNFFTKNDIRYSRHVESSKWRKLVCHYMPHLNDIKLVKIDDLKKIIENDLNTKITYNISDDSINYEFKTPAILTSSFSNIPAFANSILGPSFNYEKPIIDMADGTKIPEDIIHEISLVTEKHTYCVDWNDNDVAIIDNRRVMHGREKIISQKRKIYNALSYRK